MSLFRAGQELIYEDLHVTLLSSKVFNGHFELVERVLHAEQVVQVEREIHDRLCLGLRAATLATIHVRVAFFFVYLHIKLLIYIP